MSGYVIVFVNSQNFLSVRDSLGADLLQDWGRRHRPPEGLILLLYSGY